MSPHLILQKLLNQQKKLLEKNPDIKNYFIDIQVPQWGFSVPFLPIRCFRDFDLHTTFTEKKASQYKIYNSSGSTGNKRSRHIFSQNALKNYEKNTCQGFSEFLTRQELKQQIPIISFVPPSEVWPTSSLAAMIEMFQENQFQVTYCDIDEKKENLISILKKIPTGSDCLLFGTTFHHLMLANYNSQEFKDEVQNQFKRLSIFIVDTGGTKGRTQAFTLNQSILILKDFYSSPNFSFFSEYGMCELSSQAWSTKKIHDGTFTCNKNLFPFSISIENKTTLGINESGFIGFIDLINEESWGAIITEDIGSTSDKNIFHLIGRGPDSSIKGCSLNVTDHFTFDNINENLFIIDHKIKRNIPLHLNEICSYLKEQKNWDNYSIQDFQTIASSIEEEIPVDAAYKNKKGLIISAANTPIAWLFPYLIAAKSGAKSITIKVPSLRLDDYFAQIVINKTVNLIEVISSYFPHTKTAIDENKSLSHTFHHFDFVLTFGTDETLQTISKQIDKNKTAFIGKGDIKNSAVISVNKALPQEYVKYCSLWNGRGCLTPVALFLDGQKNEKLTWCKEFASQLETEFLNRFHVNKINYVQEFAHSHNCAFIAGQIKQLGLNEKEHIYRGKLTCVVNLSSVPEKILDKLNPEFNFGGCGFIYLFPISFKDKFSDLKKYSILPILKEYEIEN